MPSYIGDASFAKTAETGGAEEVKEAKAGWKALAKGYLRKRSAGELGLDESTVARPEKKRKKAYSWGVALGQSIRTLTGKTLEFFRRPGGPQEVDPHAWPHIAVSADQGSVGAACANFLLFQQKLNLTMLWDPSHGVWRDQEAALRACNLRSFSYLMCAVLNLGHSPWDQHSRFWQLSESTQEWLQHMSADCPLLRLYLPKILEEWSWEGAVDDETLSTVIGMLRDRWNNDRLGSGVRMCRFANLVDKLREFDERFHWTLLRVLYLGLTEGTFSADGLEQSLRLLHKPEAVGESGEGKVQVERSNDVIRRFREANKNLVQLSAQILSDPATQPLCRLIAELVWPPRAWYSEAIVMLKSPGGLRLGFDEQLVGGKIFDHKRLTLAQLSDSSVPVRLQLTLEVTDELMASDGDHPTIGVDSYISDLAGRYIMSLVSARALRLAYLWCGWAGRQAALVAGDPEVVRAACEELTRQRMAYQAAKGRHETFWKQVVHRSCMQWTSVEKLVLMLDAGGGSVSEKNGGCHRRPLEGPREHQDLRGLCQPGAPVRGERGEQASDPGQEGLGPLVRLGARRRPPQVHRAIMAQHRRPDRRRHWTRQLLLPVEVQQGSELVAHDRRLQGQDGMAQHNRDGLRCDLRRLAY